MQGLNKDTTLAALEEFSGLEFVYIPSGTYTVGIPKAAAHLDLENASGLSFWDYLPETKVTLKPFFISSKPVCLSHWHKLLQSPFSEALKNTITYDELDLHYYNLLPNKKQGYGYGFKAFLKDRHEIDPPLTLSITKSFQFAKALGVSLPNWAQWEAASRGREGFLFPWGNTFDLTQVRLSYYRYSYVWEDPESDMGLGRDRDYITAKKCRIDDFGEYANALSPFGLERLVRWGMEWNITEALLHSYRQSSYPITTHLLRSITDLQFSSTSVNLSDSELDNQLLCSSNHRAFSGTSLPMMLHPELGSPIAAFRLVYIPQQPDTETILSFQDAYTPAIIWPEQYQYQYQYLYPNGIRYKGELIDGTIQGKGVLTCANGDRYEGEFQNNRLRDGRIIKTFENGDRYEGEILNYLFHGTGVHTLASGDRYDGEFQNGRYHGRGIYTCANGDRSEGEFRDGKLHGQAVYLAANGDRAEGEFYAGKFLSGECVRTFENGDRYIGKAENNAFHGQGLLIRANGNRYEGEFCAGEYHGRGVYIYANGDRIEGEFRNNKKNGKGVYIYANGDRIEGTWQDDKFLG